MAQSGQSDRIRICPLLEYSGQRWILARDGFVLTQSGHAASARIWC